MGSGPDLEPELLDLNPDLNLNMSLGTHHYPQLNVSHWNLIFILHTLGYEWT